MRSKNLGAGRIHFARSIFTDRAPTKATLLWDGDVPIRLPLWNPSPHRPRPGASAPALDPAPAGRMPGTSSLFTIHFSLTDSTILLKSGARPLSHGCAVPAPPQGEPRVGCAPGQRQRKEKQGAQVCTTSTALLRAPGQRASGWGHWGKSSLYHTAPGLPPRTSASNRSTVLT